MLSHPNIRPGESFSIDEIARAARVRRRDVRRVIEAEGAGYPGEQFSTLQAVHLVRMLANGGGSGRHRSPLTLVANRNRRSGWSLAVSGMVHGAFLALLLLLASLGLLNATYTDQTITRPTPVRLVYLNEVGPGGGGGGGGLEMPKPPPKAEHQAPPKRAPSPVPPVRKVITPPRPDPPLPRPPVEVPRPRPEPVPVPVAPQPQAIQAPVVSAPADPVNVPGVLSAPPMLSVSNGRGTGGGLGSGAGLGLGEGFGSGLGPGTGGGTGGGVFHPGTGIDPPVLIREVRPLYTDEARRRAIEGDVVLEIVVRQDGSVGSVRVTHSLGAGLEQKAIDAVRQWRFGPARRQGAPVDVVVEVSVEFKLR